MSPNLQLYFSKSWSLGKYWWYIYIYTHSHTHTYMHIYLTPPPWERWDTSSILMGVQLISILSFPSPRSVVLPKLKSPVCLTIGEKDRFMPFPEALEGIVTVLVRIWIQVYFLQCFHYTASTSFTGAQSQVEAYQRLKKWYSLLNTQHYKVWIKSEWNNSGKGITPSPSVVAIEKGAFWSPSIMVSQLTIYIYIYIYIYTIQ